MVTVECDKFKGLASHCLRPVVTVCAGIVRCIKHTPPTVRAGCKCDGKEEAVDDNG